MKLGIEIDLTNTYNLTTLSTDLSRFQFDAPCTDGTTVPITIIIEKNRNRFLPDVYNLGFGPLNEDGTLNDTIKIKHENSSKAFSTILLSALTFLKQNNNEFIGIDGSNITRAYLYFKLLQNNYDYLIRFFQRILGVKYYVRLLRGINLADPLIPDGDDLATMPFRITKGESMRCEKLYNYFIFKLT